VHRAREKELRQHVQVAPSTCADHVGFDCC